MIEIRFHGRGGQGAWTAVQILARAAIREGMYVQSFPEFGPEREGAPIRAYARISKEPIRIHCGIYNPDIVVVLDHTLLKSVPVTSGLKENGALVLNIPEKYLEQYIDKMKGPHDIWFLDATSLAVKILGRGITNTAMLGALLKAREVIPLKTMLETTREVFLERFSEEIARKNIELIKEAYKEVKKVE